MNYLKANEILAGRPSKKIANNTYLKQRENGSIAVMLHSTDIILFLASGMVKVDSGGWKTPTTKQRLNEYLEGWQISQEKGIWYWVKPGQWDKKIPYTDGDMIGLNGILISERGPDSLQKEKELRKRISKYADLCVSKMPIAEPSGGDCWHCLMREVKPFGVDPKDHIPKTLGDLTDPKEHILSHMEEGYVVPSLVANALKERGAGALYWEYAFKGYPHHGDFMKKTIKNMIRKYVAKRLGVV
jgi:hypothetical protein